MSNFKFSLQTDKILQHRFKANSGGVTLTKQPTKLHKNISNNVFSKALWYITQSSVQKLSCRLGIKTFVVGLES